jgi:hypothetical protein
MALARKLTVIKLKQCQQLEPQKHKPDVKAFILLSSPSLICVLSNYRTFTYDEQKSISPLLARIAKRTK